MVAKRSAGPASEPGGPVHRSTADTSEAVDRFIDQLQHPFKAEVVALRRIVAAADPSILEGVKWNAPSFRTSEYFATTNLRVKSGVGLILHLGAKVRELPPGGVVVADPGHLLKWLSQDRAAVEFTGLADLEAKAPALQAVLVQWIRHV